jgi:polysaccharide biosynthesis protein PelF
MIEKKFTARSVDILLIIEGTYPFFRGGVSSWAHQLISNMPEFNFGIIFLGAYVGLYQEYEYLLPNNLIHLEVIYLFEEPLAIQPKRRYFRAKPHLNDIDRLHEVYKGSQGCPHALSAAIPDIGKMLDDKTGMSYFDFLHSEESWDYINEQYLAHSTDSSFVNYFWNIRNMHTPLWILNEALNDIPTAKIVHPVATGYSGLLASMIHQRYEMPVVLTEHGLYTREREVELLRTSMFAKVDKFTSHSAITTYQHQLWLQFFESLARTAYYYAFRVTSLFQQARAHQLANGASISKLSIIPNGVDIEKFAPLRRTPDSLIPKVVCFVGRFVRIKDIKTYIRSVAIMLNRDSSIVAWIKAVGESDTAYLQECIEYIELLGLANRIHFIEEGGMVDILANTGVIILSSISEGMPLVMLEAMAAGIPVVATDVGACRELIEGRDEEDRKLGSCGVVVSIGNAAMLADAVVTLLTDLKRWFAAQEIAIKRVEKYYSQSDMIASYKHIYEEAMIHGRNRY